LRLIGGTPTHKSGIAVEHGPHGTQTVTHRIIIEIHESDTRNFDGDMLGEGHHGSGRITEEAGDDSVSNCATGSAPPPISLSIGGDKRP
jgi:hypothetical protein